MITIKTFAFNSFQVNSFVLHDATGSCVIIDPGCYTPAEKQTLKDYIDSNGLKPVKIIATHMHIDHILGLKFVADQYQIGLACHKDAEQFIRSAEGSATVFGFELEGTVNPDQYLEDETFFKFGDSSIRILHTPGHADGSICLVLEDEKVVITGDVLFRDSIGRTDLPTGDFDVLMESINTKLFTLDDGFKAYPGHGPATSIGHEKINNPFVRIQ
ncbi:MAG: MBL fold metallo-hydrolase [Bacteroidales bacterium]|nr:MBL fold metallo-hydrolase [Bacteroidales bacterium]